MRITERSADSLPATDKIRGVEAIPLHLPLKREFTISVGGPRERLEVLVVRLHTDQGCVGVGESQAWRRQGGGEVLPNMVRLIKDCFEPLLIGRSVFDVSGSLQLLNEAYANSYYAQSAISDAMYDAMGKLTAQPVHNLLGGDCRRTVRVGTILSIRNSVEALLDDAQRAYDQGFRYFGLKIGVDADRDIENVAALRDRFGQRVSMRVDANGALTRDAAVSVLRRLEPFNIDSAEQPVPSWDLEGLAAISRLTRIPVMADESLSTDHSLLEIIRRGAASGIHTKLGKNGGLHRTWRLWALAHAAGMRICPGNHPCTSIATAAVAQMCAAWPGQLIDGVFAVGVDGTLEHDIVHQSITIRDGELLVPEGPGLAVELDVDKCQAFRADRM